MQRELCDTSLPLLSRDDFALVMEHCSADLFVTDAKGKIIYANGDAVKSIGCPLDELLRIDVYELKERGYTSHSSTADVLSSGRRCAGTYRNKLGQVIGTVSTPVLNSLGELYMVVTYSRQMDVLEALHSELSHQKTQMEHLRQAFGLVDGSGAVARNIVAEDASTQQIFASLGSLAQSDSTIMLYGESGVGKEVVAHYIQQNSRRREEIFLPINCAAIPSELIESELFGYERGAFTGASRDGKPGLLELANGGTLFMDEIGELPLMAQSKLLRVLENGEYRRVGGCKICTTDVRIIGATNRNLKEMIAQKLFRDDLYYRLNVVPILIPPLRERPLDMEALTLHFLHSMNRKHGESRVVTDEMLERIRSYAWPGNIRELRNAIERYVITGNTRTVVMDDDAPQGSPAINSGAETSAPQPERTEWEPLHTVTVRAEDAYIQEALCKCGGNVTQAAALLGLHRSVLYKKLKKRR